MSPDPPLLPDLDFRQPLGSGGYADVLLYRQRSTGRAVAVKVLRRAGLTPAGRARFLDESELMSAVGSHPNVVTILGYDQTDDGSPYLVMEYYPPPNLAVRTRREPLSVPDVLRFGIQLAGAVETIHRCGVIHRDIKPANILVSTSGVPALTDFGVAGTALTVTETPDEDLGVSVPWSPPEVLANESDGDPRSDVYSLCATLWQLLAGRSPFEVPGGDNTVDALTRRIREQDPLPIDRPDVPATLERSLARGLAKDPRGRHRSAHELARELQAVQQELGLPPTHPIVLEATQLREQLGDAARWGDRGERGDPAPGNSTAGDSLASPVTRALDRLRSAGPRAVSGVVLPGTAGTLGLGSRGRLLLLGAGVAVVAVLVILLTTLSGGTTEPAEPAAGSRPSEPAASPPAPTASAPEQPRVLARPVSGGVEFRWTYPSPDPADTFRYRSASSAGALVGMGPQPADASPITVDGPSGRTVCAQVAVVRDGSLQGPYSDVVCAPAG